MGTYTHDEDLLMILPALKTVHQRHPGQIELQVIGVVRSEETKKELVELPVRYIYPQPEEHEYPLFMLWFTGHVRWDIALSPLCDTPFTRCKSDVKFLDYAAIGTAGIYSQSTAYSSTVQHKENGWIAENTTEAWVEALETLMLDHSLRLKIAQNATRYLFSERILAQRAPDWVEIVRLSVKK
jgi:glycosyltransferase involved in cell wall biosynthesis